MPKDHQPLSKIVKAIHKKLDTYTLSLMTIEGETKTLSVLQSIVQEMGLTNISDVALKNIASKVSTLLYNLSEWSLDDPTTAHWHRSAVVDTLKDLTCCGMGVPRVSSSWQGNEILFIRGILIHLYPYILGEKELFVGRCCVCNKRFYKTSRNKMYCTESCSATYRGMMYRKRRKEDEERSGKKS